MVKGTVWPDWICMIVVSLESPLKGHQLLYVFNFYFWSWIFEKTSKFWAASCQNDSNLLLVRITVCIESCLPIGWRTFIWWKNPPKCTTILVWIAEWWMQATIQWTIDVSPAFLEHGRSRFEHMQTTIRTSRRIRGLFAWSGSELWTLIKYLRSKIKN